MNEAADAAADDMLIVVDDHDTEIGYETKATCHDGDGILHRAFSLFVFDPAGRLLLQRRADGKRLWPGYWANSCCSHPRKGESVAAAAARRLDEELGMRCEPKYVYKFGYHATFGDAGSERELCWVFVGESDSPVDANTHEIGAWEWVDPADLDRELAARPDRFTPWLKLEWARLRHDYNDSIPGPR